MHCFYIVVLGFGVQHSDLDIYIFFFFKTSILEYNCFTYIYSFSDNFPLCYYKILNIVPCAIQ